MIVVPVLDNLSKVITTPGVISGSSISNVPLSFTSELNFWSCVSDNVDVVFEVASLLFWIINAVGVTEIWNSKLISVPTRVALIVYILVFPGVTLEPDISSNE